VVWVDPAKRRKTGADIVGVTHFLLVNAIFLLGQYTTIFSHIGGTRPGVLFVYRYIDTPIYSIPWVRTMVERLSSTSVPSIACAEVIFLASSILYAAIAYLLLAVVFRLFLD
jgi:hypothetical protein